MILFSIFEGSFVIVTILPVPNFLRFKKDICQSVKKANSITHFLMSDKINCTL